MSSAPLSIREIAARLGISRGTVQNIERRALGKMRAAAAETGIGEDDFREICAALAVGQTPRREEG